jgi:DNA replication licensing factor MCM5
MDRRTPYTLSVLAPSTNGADESRSQIQNKLRDFVLEFQLDNAFIYRYIPLASFPGGGRQKK